LKRLFLLMVLSSVTGVAVAATTGTDAARPVIPHGGMTTQSGAGMSSGHPDSIPADTRLINSGKVLDVLDTDMYTYVQVTHEQGPLWLAAYKTNITRGATVKYSGGVAMTKFQSKALNRTFELIVFVDTLEQVK
jgi:hypothetical protein